MEVRHYTAFDPNDILLKADILIKAKIAFRVFHVDTFDFTGWVIEWEDWKWKDDLDDIINRVVKKLDVNK